MGGRFARNVGWNVFGNLGGRLFGPVLQVLIARLLLPDDYGAFAIGLAWIGALEVCKDWGLTQAILVRGGKPEIGIQFTVQLATAVVFCLTTLALAPVAAGSFGLPELAVVLPLMSLIALIDAVTDPVVTDCLMAQRYRALGIRQMIIPLASGLVGLVLAYQGYRVYALVAGLLVGQAAGALCVLATGYIALRPAFDWGRARHLVAFSKHIVLQRLFGFLVGHADSLIVGKALGPQALGLYRMGNLLAFLVPSASVPHVQQVTFTELLQDRGADNVRRRYNAFTNLAGLALLVYSVALYVAAPVAIPALLGEQWRDAVPLMQVFAAVVITGFVTPMNIDLAKILGFIGVYTYFGAARAAATVLAIAWAAQYSVVHAVIAWVVVGFISNLANEVIFYTRQDVVRLTGSKVALTAASWAWAAVVIVWAIP
ncbi:MAG: hypothetical protein A3G81_19500 [Betaproteobacteria bacterium RIFCSPLOWO2_12_FULL_65_14]|nr:MAG: hypothetical protein A3G81_19500 [Betaproteobacteria bacterium RIFCSPLOWO2_12_FULL_65_14]